MADPRTFTEAEHVALMTDAVQRETATVTTERDELKTKLAAAEAARDVLDAEKAAVVAERDKVTAEYTAYKTDVEEKAAVAERREARVARVKAANDLLGEDFYTDERTQRWAEMADSDFEVVVASLEAAKPAGAGRPATTVPAETAAFTGGTSPRDGGASIGRAHV